jgi:hypothetical protein
LSNLRTAMRPSPPATAAAVPYAAISPLLSLLFFRLVRARDCTLRLERPPPLNFRPDFVRLLVRVLRREL